MSDIERIKNRVNEYCKSFRNKVIMRYDNIVETDDVIQLYVRLATATAVEFFLYAMIDLDIDKKLEVYEEINIMIPNCEGPIIEFNEVYYDLRYPIYRDSIIKAANFLRALYYANFLNRPGLYRKILEMGGECNFDEVKTLLLHGDSYINNVECRTQLIDYINKHDIEVSVAL